MNDFSKTQVTTKAAPGAIGPYSQAIKSGGLLFCSGQVPIDPETGELEKPDITVQTRRVLKNIKALLEASGTNAAKVLKTTIFLTDLGNFTIVNKEYEQFFNVEGAGAPPPARSTVQVSALPRGSMIEIEAIAAL